MNVVATNVETYGKMARYEGRAFDRFLLDLQATGAVLERFGTDQHVGVYDPKAFDFDGAARRHIVAKGLIPAVRIAGVKLSELHALVAAELKDLDKTQINKFTQEFYEAGEEFNAIYRRFVGEVVSPLLGLEVFFQQTPTVRAHFPNQGGAFERPFWHSDIMLGHPPACVNVWLPITPVFGNNSIRIMEREASLDVMAELGADFDRFAEATQDAAFSKRLHDLSRPVELEPGQFLIFDPRCIHATQYNDTEATRVSLDVRVLPADSFYRGVGRRRMLFVPGHYYDNAMSTNRGG